jgi:hypothetical protein
MRKTYYAVAPSAPTLPELQAVAVLPSTTMANFTIKGLSTNSYWAIFNGKTNLSGPLTATTYTLNGLKMNTLYHLLVCTSTDKTKWSKGRKIQMRTKKIVPFKPPKIVKPKPTPKPKPPIAPKKSKYLMPPEATNPTILQGPTSVTISWDPPSDPNIVWQVTDGIQMVSPVLSGTPQYVVNYADIGNTSLYIMSSNDGTNWTLGTEVPSVIPDVQNVTMTINPDNSTTINFFKPDGVGTNVEYSVLDMQIAPLSPNDSPIAFTQYFSPLQNTNGSYTYTSLPDQSFCTIYATYGLGFTYVGGLTYGTTIYFFTQDPSLPSEVTNITQVPRSDGTGVDVSFTGTASFYMLCGSNCGASTSASTMFIPYTAAFAKNSYMFSILSSYDGFNWTNGQPFEIMFPQITNLVAIPGPTSVTLTWTPEPNAKPGTPQTWAISTDMIVSSPTATINYTFLPQIFTLGVTTNYIQDADLPFKRAFFYNAPPPPVVSTYTMPEKEDNNKWMMLILILVLFMVLKK